MAFKIFLSAQLFSSFLFFFGLKHALLAGPISSSCQPIAFMVIDNIVDFLEPLNPKRHFSWDFGEAAPSYLQGEIPLIKCQWQTLFCACSYVPPRSLQHVCNLGPCSLLTFCIFTSPGTPTRREPIRPAVMGGWKWPEHHDYQWWGTTSPRFLKYWLWTERTTSSTGKEDKEKARRKWQHLVAPSSVSCGL